MKLLYIKSDEITNETCDFFIKYFENSIHKYQGHTVGGLNLNIKKDMECTIYNSSESQMYIDNLHNIIFKNVEIYMKENNISFKNIPFYELNDFFIKKYIKNEGKFEYHDDFFINEKSVRIITYLFYLNDVEEGGETEFLGSYKIKPEKGKMIIFPCSWTFPHSGKIPISNDKYIISGWLHVDTKDYDKLCQWESV